MDKLLIQTLQPLPFDNFSDKRRVVIKSYEEESSEELEPLIQSSSEDTEEMFPEPSPEGPCD